MLQDGSCWQMLRPCWMRSLHTCIVTVLWFRSGYCLRRAAISSSQLVTMPQIQGPASTIRQCTVLHQKRNYLRICPSSISLIFTSIVQRWPCHTTRPSCLFCCFLPSTPSALLPHLLFPSHVLLVIAAHTLSREATKSHSALLLDCGNIPRTLFPSTFILGQCTYHPTPAANGTTPKVEVARIIASTAARVWEASGITPRMQ
eukprot:1161410-Pelagomonas_calceolata.AAC.3